MIAVVDEWKKDGDTFRAVDLGEGAWDAQRWSPVMDAWVNAGIGDVIERLAMRVTLHHLEAKRISFLAGALMRMVQLAEKLHAEAPAGFANLAKRYLASLKGVTLACWMPLAKWGVDIEGVEEDPETAELRRRLGLDDQAAN